jgi:cytochrome c556
MTFAKLAFFLVVLTALRASSADLSPVARKYAIKREAMLKEFSAERRILMETARWKALPPEKRKAALDALTAQAKKRDERLLEREDAEERAAKPKAGA